MLKTHPDKFIELLTQNQSRVYAYVRTLLPNYSDAEEVFQQTVLVLWRKWKQFDASRDFAAWACGIAHLEVRNFLRKSERRNKYLSDEVLASLAATANEAHDWLDIRQAALAACMDKLNAHERSLLDTCYLQSAQLCDAAPKLRLSANALYKSLRKIRKRLIECVDRTLQRESQS